MDNKNVSILNKSTWNNADFDDYYLFLNTIKGNDFNCAWEQKIVNTKLPCFSIGSKNTRLIANEIYKGNYTDFLKNIEFRTHVDTLVFAFILNKIKDFDLYEKFLINFSHKVDNWASCDTLKYKNKDKQKLFYLCNKLLVSSYTFARRIAVNILFEFISKDIDVIFNILDSLSQEKEYYVNMSAAWLLCECFIKCRQNTLNYFELNKTNSFIINKAISKCCDSFRVSKEDKILLKQFKK
ncbi:MAG: DNA alkylation repair protein [Clostridia bacterium]|nr:DNA alkylation repair protein [Clostridia bacterium]